jgi:hypothetical protein
MAVPIRMILKEIGSRINNIGTIVDTDPNNDETTSYMGKMLEGAGSFGGGLKDIGSLKDSFKNSKDAKDAASTAKDVASAASAAKDVAAAVSDKKLKDIANNDTTEDVIERAYQRLDNIIYKYNQKGQALGEDDQLRAGVTAQSMQGSILESNVFKDPETGFLKVDTAQLALSNAAAIKTLFDKIDELEKLIKK